MTSRSDIANKSFGTAGFYEELSGRIFFTVDPHNSANRIITDIDKARRNAAGKAVRRARETERIASRGAGIRPARCPH